LECRLPRAGSSSPGHRALPIRCPDSPSDCGKDVLSEYFNTANARCLTGVVNLENHLGYAHFLKTPDPFDDVVRWARKYRGAGPMRCSPITPEELRRLLGSSWAGPSISISRSVVELETAAFRREKQPVSGLCACVAGASSPKYG
jgi:hypothetical protein